MCYRALQRTCISILWLHSSAVAVRSCSLHYNIQKKDRTNNRQTFHADRKFSEQQSGTKSTISVERLKFFPLLLRLYVQAAAVVVVVWLFYCWCVFFPFISSVRFFSLLSLMFAFVHNRFNCSCFEVFIHICAAFCVSTAKQHAVVNFFFYFSFFPCFAFAVASASAFYLFGIIFSLLLR